MKKLYFVAAAALLAAGTISAQYITPAPAGGFDTKTGKDYVVLYAPESVITGMEGRIATNCNLDPDQVNNTLEYWTTDWDSKALTLYNVPAEEGEVNSFGEAEFINATPLYEWGTGVFVPKAKDYDLSKVTPEHHIHIGLRDFGSAPSKYQFAIGPNKSVKTNGFQIMVGIGLGKTSGDYVGIGELPNGNDGKWYYLDVPVADLIDENGEFGFSYNFSNPIKNNPDYGAFSFSFNSPTCSTYKTSGPEPGESIYTYEITKLGSALSLDHVFFYVPDASGINGITNDVEKTVEVYYDLAGRQVANPSNGIYIVKTNTGSYKKIIK